MNTNTSRSSLRQSFGRLINCIEQKPASDRLILRVLFFAIIGVFLWGLLGVNNAYLAATPVPGGTIVEGVVGIPRFVNPVLAVTRADQDMSALLYSGVMKINSDGILVPDLAESVTVSDDGRTYNIVMRRDARFHDDTPLTARDVAFTIGLIQNPDLKSPLRGNWVGVTLQEISEYEINIVLDEPYTPFIENFTIGIIPRHIWSGLPIEQVPFSQRNTEPIGSGNFKLKKVIRNDAGLIETYELSRARDNIKLEALTVRFYQNEADLVTAFSAGELTSTANLPLESLALAEDGNYNLIEKPLPRVFGLFFNQNRSVALRDAAVREALEMVLDRDALVAAALNGYGVPTNTPLPPRSTSSPVTFDTADALAKATDRLTRAGWQKNQNNLWEKRIDGNAVTLSFTIRTANTSLLERTTTSVAEPWRALGIQVDVEAYEQSDLLQAVIRPRDFEILLFGLDMNRSVDLYPFWHSSQREDPGLNIAQYANIEVDSLLATARTGTSSSDRDAKATTAMNIISNERPALFLFVPTLTYVVHRDVTVASMEGLSKPQERFMNIENWHVAKEDRWPLFR
ncbi:MAG: ABC transporter substrate-binding protein [Candidatus Pacebacteria bacterium]|nr:ABC transporter substrate-binding protein [Candidatus Paceibacterota bacterium]